MQVKKFKATSMHAVLDLVKKEFGPDAVILQTKSLKRPFSGKSMIEVTVAVSEKYLNNKKKIESKIINTEGYKALSSDQQSRVIEKYLESNPKEIPESLYEKKSEKPIFNYGNKKKSTSLAYENANKEDFEMSDDVDVSNAFLTDQARMQKEIFELKSLLLEINKKNETSEKEKDIIIGFKNLFSDDPVLQEIYDKLVFLGIERKYAYHLLRTTIFELGSSNNISVEALWDFIISEMSSQIKVEKIDFTVEDKKVFHFIGPQGSGKTSIAVKMAYHIKKKFDKSSGFIYIDLGEDSSFEQLAVFARLFNFPFRIASSIEDLKLAMSDFESLDCVMIESSGFNIKSVQNGNNDVLLKMKKFMEYLPHKETFLVVSLWMKEIEVYEWIKPFVVNHFGVKSVLNLGGICFTRLDQVYNFSSIYNLMKKLNLPVFFLSSGRNVPHDLEKADSDKIVSLILDV